MATRAFPGRVTGGLDPEKFVGDEDMHGIEGKLLSQTLAPAEPTLQNVDTLDHTMEPDMAPAPGTTPTPAPGMG